jgi:phosphoribosyl 1,2-cyclic phosphodiesterase
MRPTLFVLGSGSRGNCLALKADDGVLLIDAGFSLREIERRAELVGVSLEEVKALVLTHEHGDHSAGAPGMLKKLGVPVLTSGGTWQSLRTRFPDGTRHQTVGMSSTVEIGPFRIDGCPTSHDAVESIAVVIRAGGCRLGIAYDLGRPTTAVRYLLRDCTALVLEANYDDLMLRTSGYPPVVQQRIAGSGGHLSNRAAAEMIASLMHPGLTMVVLAHLSEKCNSEECARSTVQQALKRTRWDGSLHVARQDEPLHPLPIPQPAVLSFDFFEG